MNSDIKLVEKNKSGWLMTSEQGIPTTAAVSTAEEN